MSLGLKDSLRRRCELKEKKKKKALAFANHFPNNQSEDLVVLHWLLSASLFDSQSTRTAAMDDLGDIDRTFKGNSGTRINLLETQLPCRS